MGFSSSFAQATASESTSDSAASRCPDVASSRSSAKRRVDIRLPDGSVSVTARWSSEAQGNRSAQFRSGKFLCVQAALVLFSLHLDAPPAHAWFPGSPSSNELLSATWHSAQSDMTYADWGPCFVTPRRKARHSRETIKISPISETPIPAYGTNAAPR